MSLAAILPFLSTIPAYFAGDDFGLVWLYSQKPFSHILTLFTTPWTENIYGQSPDELRPLIALSYQVDALWGASSPIAYHVSNILYHLTTTLIVFAIARSVVGLALPAATFAATLFAVMRVHAETVAWIAGRADSIPALFYLGSFLAYAMWRRQGPRWLYGASVGLFFLALYSKQPAITMLATLACYDVLVDHPSHRRARSSTWRYVPFALMTLCYLVLRFVLFGNVVRENRITAETFKIFARRQSTYLQAVAFGAKVLHPDAFTLIALAGIAMALLYPAWAHLRRTQSDLPVRWGALFYFGPVWWLISVAPLAVTYLSLRHLYLAAAGFAIATALALEALWNTRRHLWRSLSVLGGASLILAQTLTLQSAVTAWNGGAAMSQKIVRDMQQAAATASPGSLLVLSAPKLGMESRVWIWAWALPFAAEPPFSPPRLREHVVIISNKGAYSPRDQWFVRTRQTITDWAARSDHPPVEVLRWDAYSGELVRQSSMERPQLRSQVLQLAETETPQALRDALSSIFLDLPR